MDSRLLGVGHGFSEKQLVIVVTLFLGVSILLTNLLGSAVTQAYTVSPSYTNHICTNVFDQTHVSNTNGMSNTSVAKITLDNSNIPIVDYGRIHGIYIGPQRNPVTISQKALYYYDLFRKTLNTNVGQSLINNANWLVENAKSRGNYSILDYKFPYPPYNMTPPWQSAMAQGQAMQALVDAYKITSEKKYLDKAKMLLNSFFVEVKNGGVTYKTPANGWWYEEYATSGGKESRVLNGMMSSLLAIYYYYNYTHDLKAKYLFDKGVLGLDKSLPSYDKNGYSSYDILGRPSTSLYHLLHIDLLGKLYKITKDEIFKAFHDRWQNYNKIKLPSQKSLPS